MREKGNGNGILQAIKKGRGRGKEVLMTKREKEREHMRRKRYGENTREKSDRVKKVRVQENYHRREIKRDGESEWENKEMERRKRMVDERGGDYSG